MMAERDFLPDTCNPNKEKTFESFQLKRTLEIPVAEFLGSSIRLQKSAWRCGTAVQLAASALFHRHYYTGTVKRPSFSIIK